MTEFKKGDKVQFVAGNGKTYVGKFLRMFYPARNSGPHYKIEVDGGTIRFRVKNASRITVVRSGPNDAGYVGMAAKHMRDARKVVFV